MKITEYFHETGETIEREATPEELASIVVTPTLDEIETKKAAAKTAFLERLGITPEEAELLIK
jgi:hypothetical protein